MKTRIVAFAALVAALFAVVSFVGCTGGGNGTGGGNQDGDSNAVIIAMSGNMFAPTGPTVMLGQTVTWVNNDATPHTVTSDALNPVAGGPDSATQYPAGIPPGSSYSWKFSPSTLQGTTWYYHCDFHGTAGDGQSLGSGMVGVVYAF